MGSLKKSSRRTSKKHQKLYKMKGCSKRSRKNHLGGSSGNINLAYPSNNVKTEPNPFLAYSGKGGSFCSSISSPNLAPANTNGSNPAYPSTGPSSGGFNFLNSQTQRGGNCGCGLQMGGSMGGSCGTGMCPLAPSQTGGTLRHRMGCRCSTCKMKQMGGSSLLSNNGIPYPNGLVGSPWTPSVSGWPGVDGISGDSNYLGYNTYQPNDVSRQMINTGAQPPFSVGGRKTRKGSNMRRGRKGQRGGVISNFLGQDLINLGRQLQNGFGTAYNGLAGYPSPVNPLPWKGQLQNTSNLSKIH
jgi:hypothetical protein